MPLAESDMSSSFTGQQTNDTSSGKEDKITFTQTIKILKHGPKMLIPKPEVVHGDKHLKAKVTKGAEAAAKDSQTTLKATATSEVVNVDPEVTMETEEKAKQEEEASNDLTIDEQGVGEDSDTVKGISDDSEEPVAKKRRTTENVKHKGECANKSPGKTAKVKETRSNTVLDAQESSEGIGKSRKAEEQGDPSKAKRRKLDDNAKSENHSVDKGKISGKQRLNKAIDSGAQNIDKNSGAIDVDKNSAIGDINSATPNIVGDGNTEAKDLHKGAIEDSNSGTQDVAKISSPEIVSSGKNNSKQGEKATNSGQQRDGETQTDYDVIPDSVTHAAKCSAKKKGEIAGISFEKKDAEPQAVSTYDKVRVLIQPWRKPEGGVNKPIFKMFVESIMLYIMNKPGLNLDDLEFRYTPYLQPMVIRYVLDILEDIGCLTRKYMKVPKTSLFSKPTTSAQELFDEYDSEDCIMLITPEIDCVLTLGQFALELYPGNTWPESAYPTIKSLNKDYSPC